jgi:hypothetical protein
MVSRVFTVALLLGLGSAFGRRFAWLLWAMCKSLVVCLLLGCLLTGYSAKEAVEKLTGDKVTAKH